MTGRRLYGESEMSALLQNGRVSSETFEALLSSNSFHGVFTGSSGMLNFELVCGNTIKECLDEDFDDCFHQPEKKRRLTANQVQLLEKSFEAENKLEPGTKIQLAKELGLQPRQIAIWFQNRRAQWKTKQLEKDYESLRSRYDVLKADYENLHKEKEKLKAEVVHLTDKLLLKRKHEGIMEALELNRPDYDTIIKAEEFNNRQVGIKQEDHSSTNSVVSDSESPHRIDGARTVSNACQSDISYVDDDEFKGYHHFLKLEDHSCDFNFPTEDHTFWLWP